VYTYHQHLYEVRERKKQREREAEVERLRHQIRALRRQRRDAYLAAVDLLIGHARRAAGLKLDT
jgi:hypothetical protein